MTLATALQQGTELLSRDSIAAPRLTAEVLLAHAIGRDRVYLFAHPDEALPELGWIHYGRYLHQRLNGVPTQYITGRQEFYGREFRVTRDVLIPRPETEHVVTAALQRLSPGAAFADIGTGSGAIAVTLALESHARGYASDISPAALRVAGENAKRWGAGVTFVCADALTAFGSASLDIVVSNPPYVAFAEQDSLQREVRDHEPHVALFAGSSGTDLYRRIIEDAPRVLRPGGFLVFELGWRSLGPVRAMLTNGWTDIVAEPDLGGIPRVLAARWAP